MGRRGRHAWRGCGAAPADRRGPRSDACRRNDPGHLCALRHRASAPERRAVRRRPLEPSPSGADRALGPILTIAPAGRRTLRVDDRPRRATGSPAMNSRFRFGPPKQMLPQTSGSRMRPISLRVGIEHRARRYSRPTRPALLERQTLPSTSQRTPSGPHFTPSITKSLNSLLVRQLVVGSRHRRHGCRPCRPARYRPGPLPVEAT